MSLSVSITAAQALRSVRGLPFGIIPLGKVWWVDSTASNNADTMSGGHGGFDAPFTTILFAVSQCVSGRGDIILAKPNHVETISGANFVIDKNGVAIIGLGDNTQAPRPHFLFSTNHSLSITGTGVLIHNFNLTASTTVVTGAVVLNGNGDILSHCLARGDNHANVFTINADDCLIWQCSTATQATPVTNAKGVTITSGKKRPRIFGNLLVGDFGGYAIGANTNVLDMWIEGNKINNVENDAEAGFISIASGGTGYVGHNEGFYGYVTDVDTAIAGGDCALCENYVSNVAEETGALVPTAVSA